MNSNNKIFIIFVKFDSHQLLKDGFHPISSRYSNATTVNTNESHHLTRHLSYKSVEQAFDKSSNSYKASIISQYNNADKKSPSSDINELTSGRHKPNALSVQSGILSNVSASKNKDDFKSRNQSPLSNPNIIQSVISENSQEMKYDGESDTYEKVQIEHTTKVSESVDKLLKDNATARQGRKILMIGEKKVTGEVSSSSSRERELIKFYKNPALIKSKDINDKNSEMKLTHNNINKELVEKYANKFDIGKKKLNSDTRLSLTHDKENIPTNLLTNEHKNVINSEAQSPPNNFTKYNTISNTPSAKENCEENDDNIGINSPPEFTTPRTAILLDKACKNKLSNLHFGKGKLGCKNQRNNFLKPPKKSYTINSNRNSSSDSSFASIAQIGVRPTFQEQFTPGSAIRGSFEVKSNTDFLNNTAHTILRKNDGCELPNKNIYSTVDFRGSDINDLCTKASNIVPCKFTNMMTMQSQYKSKAPCNSKKFKKKDAGSTTTFRKINCISSNGIVVCEGIKNAKNKSSRSRLKTVDSKGKLVSFKEYKTVQDINANYNNDHLSSGKKKKPSNKKNSKLKQSPKCKPGIDFAQKAYPSNRTKDFQSNVKFNPLTKDPSTTSIRRSMNF